MRCNLISPAEFEHHRLDADGSFDRIKVFTVDVLRQHSVEEIRSGSSDILVVDDVQREKASSQRAAEAALPVGDDVGGFPDVLFLSRPQLQVTRTGDHDGRLELTLLEDQAEGLQVVLRTEVPPRVEAGGDQLRQGQSEQQGVALAGNVVDFGTSERGETGSASGHHAAPP
ncbi:hypothetical protein QR77_41295 [Streptomyces sp. 150FB]|nr:hypothetical protein QR77_41295 [Streptomyces sp. 150FB]